MDINEFSRTELILGKENLKKLEKSHIAVFGVGGVGSYCVEALARTGIGTFTLIDNDKVCITNINRQIIALHNTIGKLKVDVMKERIKNINPNAEVFTYSCFYTKETKNILDYTKFDYMIDAIDTVSSKIMLAEISQELNIPLISSMGAGNKLDPTKFEICDIKKTSVCPLAKVMRKELRARNINSLKVVYSKEVPIKINYPDDNRKNPPGSIAFVPSVAGLIISGEVVKDIINIKH